MGLDQLLRDCSFPAHILGTILNFEYLEGLYNKTIFITGKNFITNSMGSNITIDLDKIKH